MGSARLLSALALLAVACSAGAPAGRPTGTHPRVGVECTTSADCAPLPCAHRKCEHDHCVLADPVIASDALTDVPGDCRYAYCDEHGSPRSMPKLDDVPQDDGDPCTNEVCIEGFPTRVPADSTTTCGDQGVCSVAGGCLHVEAAFVHPQPSRYACVRPREGGLVCSGVLREAKTDHPGARVPIDDPRAVAIARFTACALDGAGRVSCWGTGADPGRAGEIAAAKPVEIDEVRGATALVAGDVVFCARTADGVRCWDTATRPVPPTRAPFDASHGLVAAGSVVCALGATDEVRCQRLGLGGLRGSPTGPTMVDGLRGATRLFLSDTYLCGLFDGGAVRCADDDPGAATSTVPFARVVPIGGLTGIVEIAPSERAACARNDAGDVWCWTSTTTAQPVARVDLAPARQLAGTGAEVCALARTAPLLRCTRPRQNRAFGWLPITF